MFTLEQIKAAHSLVKSGADFPAYIKNIKNLGVTHYETFVCDGNTDYYGANAFKISTGLKYVNLEIAIKANLEQFIMDLKAHQQGKTDYPTFCKDCAASGIEKWLINIEKRSCTYFDLAGNEMLEETIPQ